jgi:hypothetical protein
MNRKEFFAKVDGLDEARLKRVLWNLYWRGSAPIRQRIEAELDPVAHAEAKAKAAAVDPDFVLDDVRDFVELVRSGAYIGGDRRVSPRERTRWRFTFQRLVTDARTAVLDPEGLDAGAAAMESLVDLACEMKGLNYVRSEDPVESARFVVSDAATLLWEALLRQRGFATFAETAARQLVRWESRFGWTRSGDGKTAEKETTLATVLVRLLRVPDAWDTFTDRYVAALDEAAAKDAARPSHPWQIYSSPLSRRSDALAEWNRTLLDRLQPDDPRLDRLARHAALTGPEREFFAAQLAYRRGDLWRARTLVRKCLETYPGSRWFREFAAELDQLAGGQAELDSRPDIQEALPELPGVEGAASARGRGR